MNRYEALLEEADKYPELDVTPYWDYYHRNGFLSPIDVARIEFHITQLEAQEGQDDEPDSEND